MSNKGALNGILVLDLSRLLPGPYCSMILADHGARVISIEDKRFAKDGLFLSIVNRNKQHINLDLKSEEGKEIFFRMAKDADVVLEGFRPGVVKRLGVDYETLSKINPGIICCSVTGYGQKGPARDRAGHDVNYLGTSGILDLIGEKDRPPSIPAVQFADIAGGGMNAAIGILLALQARHMTGKGQYIDISMTDSMVAFLPLIQQMHQMNGSIMGRADSFLSHRYAFYNTYETKDGRYLAIGALEYRFWKALCDHLGISEYAKLQYDEDRREEIIDLVRDIFMKKNLSEWEQELSELDVCFSPVSNFEEVLEDPLFHERQMVVKIDGKDGKKLTTLGVPAKLSDTPGSVRTPPPGFGENTREILEEFGYSSEAIKTFEEKDVI